LRSELNNLHSSSPPVWIGSLGQQLNINSNVLSKTFNLLQKLDTGHDGSQLQTFVAATLGIAAMGCNEMTIESLSSQADWKELAADQPRTDSGQPMLCRSLTAAEPDLSPHFILQ
jgi:hypothetical protein